MTTPARIVSVLKAPQLDDSITGIESFGLSNLDLKSLPELVLPDNLRLGHLVERIFYTCIQASSNYHLLHENVQLQEGQTTIGELDFIIEEMDTSRIIHLELAYKFYLYDPSISNNPIKNWIGPNRNDSLHLKLKKLKEKQFPLLHHKVLESQLGGLASSEITQALCFMASLYLPFQKKVELDSSYQKAVKGHYLHYSDFQRLDHSGSSYNLPAKKEWGIDPSEKEKWMDYEKIKEELDQSLNEKRSRLVWQKEGGIYRTFFVVWWQEG